MRKTIAAIASMVLLGCGDSGPDFDTQIWLSRHVLLPGDTATIMLRIANLSGRPQNVLTECKPPYFVTDFLSGDTVSVPAEAPLCFPPGSPQHPLQPNDTLAMFYFWNGNGGSVSSGRLPEGLYTVHGNIDRFRWPSDTIRILP